MIGRRQYLLETAALLWPGEGRVDIGGPAPRGGDGPDGAQEFVLVPSADAPKLVVPAHPRRVAASAVLGYGVHGSRRGRLRTRVLAAALGAGGGAALRGRLHVAPGGDGLDTHLSAVLGEPLRLALHIGPPRANRKPVVQLLSPAGRTVAFAKLGTTPLAGRLVDAEAAALARLAAVPPPEVTVPTVLHHGTWNGVRMLVQSALPVRGSRPLRPAERVRAMVAVARSAGTATAAVGDSTYLTALRDRVAALPPSPSADRLAALAGGFARDDTALEFGAWHGDWTPWNAAGAGDRAGVLIWDWERYGPDVPVGLDAVHHALQTLIAGSPPVRAQADAVLAAAPDLLAPFDVAPGAARTVAQLYLVDLATRYLADDQAAAGGTSGRIWDWLLPALEGSPP